MRLLCASVFGLVWFGFALLWSVLAEGGPLWCFGFSLLDLGAGESGKSTILKQMKILFLESYDEEERKNFLSVIHSNMIESMKTLITHALSRCETISFFFFCVCVCVCVCVWLSLIMI